MTYCVALRLDSGMIFASDSRTNAGVDHIATFCKMRVYEKPGDRVIVLLSSGNLAITQGAINILDRHRTARIVDIQRTQCIPLAILVTGSSEKEIGIGTIVAEECAVVAADHSELTISTCHRVGDFISGADSAIDVQRLGGDIGATDFNTSGEDAVAEDHQTVE